MSGKPDYGKGDRYRKVDHKKWNAAWKRYEEAKEKNYENLVKTAMVWNTKTA